MILDRHFLATTNSTIYCMGRLMTLSFGNMIVNLDIFIVIKEVGDDEDICEVNVIESVVQEFVDHFSCDDPLKSFLVSPKCVEEVTIPEVEFLNSILEHSEVMETNGWTPRFEELPPIEKRVLPSKEKPPKPELKPSPSHLRYSFLGSEETFPVIISSLLNLDQETKLLEILKAHQTAVG